MTITGMSLAASYPSIEVTELQHSLECVLSTGKLGDPYKPPATQGSTDSKVRGLYVWNAYVLFVTLYVQSVAYARNLIRACEPQRKETHTVA
jgi:hypothetical protein